MKNNRIIFGLVILLTVVTSCQRNRSDENIERLFINDDNKLIEESISQIENGLTPAFQVADQPKVPFNILERMEYYDVPGVSIAIIRNNEIEWAKSYGTKIKNSTDSVTINTLFQAASLSKPITALIVLKMADEGIISLDSNINKQLSSWQITENEYTRKQPVTPRNLILHTSGLNVSNYPGYEIGKELPWITDILNGKKNSNTDSVVILFEPNTRWSYSGAGYTVLQLLMTEKMNASFPELMQKELFEPLDICNSTFEQEKLSDIRDDIAFGYLENGEMVEKGYHLYPEMAAAGLWTTPIDYARIVCEIQKAYHGKSNLILNEETAKIALSKHYYDMGLGFIMRNDSNEIALAFGGGNHGYICDVYSYLHLGSGAVIMTNSDNGYPLVEEIYRSISAEYNWKYARPDTIRPISPDTSIINRIKGTYTGLTSNNKEFLFTISGDNNLIIKVDNKKYPIYAVSKTKFIMPEQGWKIEIFKNNYQIDSIKYRIKFNSGIAKHINHLE